MSATGPTAVTLPSVRITTVVASRATSATEWLSQGNPLVTCVNKALATLRANGTLAGLAKKYLKIYVRVPAIQP